MNPKYGTLDWLIARLHANRLTGKEQVSFNTSGAQGLKVLSFYYSPDGKTIEIDIGREGE